MEKYVSYEDGHKDRFGCPYYNLYTRVNCEKDGEYFKKRGYNYIIGKMTFRENIKLAFKIENLKYVVLLPILVVIYLIISFITIVIKLSNKCLRIKSVS